MGITQRNAGQFGSNAMFADSLRGYASPTASFQLTPELSRVLRYLTSLLYHYDRSFEAKRLGFALMGISRLSSDLPEMRELIGNITVKARDAWGDINGQELSMCLHGTLFVSMVKPAKMNSHYWTWNERNCQLRRHDVDALG